MIFQLEKSCSVEYENGSEGYGRKDFRVLRTPPRFALRSEENREIRGHITSNQLRYVLPECKMPPSYSLSFQDHLSTKAHFLISLLRLRKDRIITIYMY